MHTVVSSGTGSRPRSMPTKLRITYTSLHDFTNGADGAGIKSNLVFDSNGNLYGTASQGGTGGGGPYCSQYCGVIFEITHN